MKQKISYKEYYKKCAATIKSGIPIPKLGQKLKKYPFEKMKVGDSFTSNNRSAASKYAKNKTVQFSTRRVKNGYRIWRTA